MRLSTFAISMRASVVMMGALLLAGYAAGQQSARSHAAYSGDLVSALEFISTTFHLPIIAELPKSYPAHVLLPGGEDTAEQLLNALTGQAPGYTWVSQDSVVLFYNSQLHYSAGNFFNAKIATFVMPADVAELKLELNGLMGSAPGTAPVMAGAPEKQLQKTKLHQGEVLNNITGRDVLVEAARQSNNLFSVILFPTADPKTEEDANQAHMNWYVRSIDELPHNPTRLRSIPEEVR